MKGKILVKNAEVPIFEALKSGLRFKNLLCEAILKELKHLSRSQDHKVIDIWLLVLICTNGGSLKKNAENVIRRKIVEGFFQKCLFDQCVHGQKDLVKGNFSTYLSICEYLLACKEKQAREIGIHIYISLFKEFTDRYSRQEVLGQLVSHIGSGVAYEVNASLETMVLLTTKFLDELYPFLSHIHGILDYLEAFSDENLNKVYGIFCQLSSHAKSNGDAIGDTIASELFLIVRKQVGNPDMKYRRMGIIGALKIVSMLGDASSTVNISFSQKSNSEEALELLKMSLESCKAATISLILLYDELIALVRSVNLHPPILEWLGMLATEFEPVFLADLEGGKLPCRELSNGVEGELWMNLDGDLSPVCLNVLQLLCSTQRHCRTSYSLLLLPVHFLLLSVVEMSSNQGSLGGIDALLGCPLHLPSLKYFDESKWNALSGDKKKMILSSIYHAVNWIRELVNVFSTQINEVDIISQSAKEEITLKLLKRLRNLLYLECLLNSLLKFYPISLPELQMNMKHSGLPFAREHNKMPCDEKINEYGIFEGASPERKRKRKTGLKDPKTSVDNCKLRQPTIVEILKKTGAMASQNLSNEAVGPSSVSPKPQPTENLHFSGCQLDAVDICAIPSCFDKHRLKLRPFHMNSLFILSCSQKHGSCCSDSAAELPVHLYLLREFRRMLECLSLPGMFLDSSASVKPGSCKLAPLEFLVMVRPLFSSLRKHLTIAKSVLEEGPGTCHDHWKTHSASAGNPEISYLSYSKLSAANFVLAEIFCCYRKMLKFPDLYTSTGLLILKQLLEAFQLDEGGDHCSGVQPPHNAGNLDYLYNGAFSFLESMMGIACSFSFLLASEVLMTEDTILNSMLTFLYDSPERDVRSISLGPSKELCSSSQKKLASSAHRILTYNWYDDEKIWKGKGEIMQKILCIYLHNAESVSAILVHLACSVMPQVSCVRSRDMEVGLHDFATLCSTTLLTWYKVLHEVNFELLNKLIKGLLSKSMGSSNVDVNEVLIELCRSVDVMVSLVSICKIHEKVAVHAMAIKYGGKFVDIFIKAFDFLEIHFRAHNDSIIQMVKKLQKATRIIHTLCSEAKVSKHSMVTTKIPATKRSMERFLFRVKALLHKAADGCEFWLGNLKHKDLHGQVVSSQIYMEAEEASSPLD